MIADCRVAVRVAVRCGPAQFNDVSASRLSCGTNAYEPGGPAPFKRLIRRFDRRQY
jgi:hypothetical protein